MTQRVREATPADLSDILRLVHELAIYEKEPDKVEATEAHFAGVLFPESGEPTAFCHIAEVDVDGVRRVVGIAVWFLSFSTWTGVNGIWLEDLFVEPEHRGSGLGQELLRTLARVCLDRGYRRLEWWVLDWNTPSIGFYESLGAVGQDEWTTFRIDGDALTRLGGVA
jgi:GNAT superfamily N-acetyltransferase